MYTISDSICDSAPCVNGGTCSVVAGAVSCACVTGYSGATCAGNFDQSSDCFKLRTKHVFPLLLVIALHSVKIHRVVTSVLIDSVCDSSPCQNGGTCSVVAGAVSCACVPGFSGDTCGSKSDLRLLLMWSHHYTCIYVLLF